MPLLQVEKLWKDFPQRAALKGVDISVDRGEIFALLGPSGAGKTTFLRIVNFLETPSKGRIVFDGIDVGNSTKDYLSLRRRMGMAFQKSTLFDTTVFGNVAYGLRVRRGSLVPKLPFGKDKDVRERVEESLKLVGLDGYAGRPASSLSGGEAQRVALAQLIVIQPELMLLDEPTANLDPTNVSLIEDIIMRMRKELRTTIILATHNIFQAKRIADRVGLLLDGELIEVNTNQRFFRDPHDERSRRFLEGRLPS